MRSEMHGTMLATTLDPEHHADISVPGPDGELVAMTHQKASDFVNNIVHWARKESASKSGLRRSLRRSQAYLSAGLSWLITLGFYGLPFGALGAFIVYRSDNSGLAVGPIQASAAVLGVLGSIASIASWFSSRRAERSH